MATAIPTSWNPCPPDTEVFANSVPPRFIRGLQEEGPNVPALRWEETKKWRIESGIDEILDRPLPKYFLIKQHTKAGYYSYSKDGKIVYIDHLAQSNVPLLREKGVSNVDYQEYFLFITEACYRVLSPDNDSNSITIYDMKGVGLSDFAGDKLELFKSVSKYFQQHYVERSGTICIINATMWFRMAMKIISPFIHPNTRKKIVVLDSNYQSELVKIIGADSLPVYMGGNNPASLDDSPFETLLQSHVREVLEKNGIPAAE